MQKAIGVEVSTAQGCAWRAVYVAVLFIEGDAASYMRPVTRRQVAHIGIDPMPQAAVFGGVAWGRWGWSFRARLPFMAWRSGQCRLRTKWQRAVKSLDGRFGRT
jgi:hypothetical protein